MLYFCVLANRASNQSGEEDLERLRTDLIISVVFLVMGWLGWLVTAVAGITRPMRKKRSKLQRETRRSEGLSEISTDKFVAQSIISSLKVFPFENNTKDNCCVKFKSMCAF